MSPEQLLRLRQVLEQTRHELVCLHGLVVTDRPDLITDELVWPVDNRSAIANLDAVIGELFGTDTNV